MNALEIQNLSKTFAGQIVLDRVGLTVGEGEVHALVGQNGSGKSTVIKVLAGYHDPMPVHRRPCTASHSNSDRRGTPTPSACASCTRTSAWCSTSASPRTSCSGGGTRAARRRHQVEGDAGGGPGPMARAGSTSTFGRTSVSSASPTARASRSPAPYPRTTTFDHRARRADGRAAGSRVELLFGTIRRLQDAGNSIVIVSHHLDEILGIADAITVLRDGKQVATVGAATSITTRSRA